MDKAEFFDPAKRWDNKLLSLKKEFEIFETVVKNNSEALEKAYSRDAYIQKSLCDIIDRLYNFNRDLIESLPASELQTKINVEVSMIRQELIKLTLK